MSRRRRDIDYLQDIHESLRRIQHFAEGLTFEAFLEDIKTQDAILRNFEVIGEATKQLSETLRTHYAKFPWRELARMRDKLIHHYFGVSYEIVWQVVQEVPQLLSEIERILRDFERS